MCEGGDCPLKDKCYRHRAIPCQLQSYFSEVPWDGEACKWYIPVEQGDMIRSLTDIKSLL